MLYYYTKYSIQTEVLDLMFVSPQEREAEFEESLGKGDEPVVSDPLIPKRSAMTLVFMLFDWILMCLKGPWRD